MPLSIDFYTLVEMNSNNQQKYLVRLRNDVWLSSVWYQKGMYGGMLYFILYDVHVRTALYCLARAFYCSSILSAEAAARSYLSDSAVDGLSTADAMLELTFW